MGQGYTHAAEPELKSRVPGPGQAPLGTKPMFSVHGQKADAPGPRERRWRRKGDPLGAQGPRSQGQRRQSCLSSLAPATLTGWVCQCTDIYLVGRRASFLLDQDAKNNRAQLPRAPAQLAPACPPRRPFSWVLRANCFVSTQLLVPRTSSGSQQEGHCALSFKD